MIKVTQIDFQELNSNVFDIIIASSGFEERASHQISTINLISDKKIVFSFSNEKENEIRKKNDIIFAENNFTSIEINGHETNDKYFHEFVSTFLSDVKKSEVNVYIDFSSMTRNWYAQLLYFFNYLANGKRINLYFNYSVAEYESSMDHDILNKVVEPIFGFCSLTIPVKPTALVICLGNEKNRAYGLQEYFDATTYLFHSDSSVNKLFSDEVLQVNKELLKNTSPDHIFQYPLSDISMTYYYINNLCNALSEKFRVVIAPCGPKLFTLLSLISSINSKGKVEVWRISPAENVLKFERKPSGEVITCHILIEK